MIVISGALVLVALVLLVVGLTMTDLPFVYGSIAVSLLALVFLVLGILQRRNEQLPAASGGPSPAPSPSPAPTEGATAALPVQTIPAADLRKPGSSVRVDDEPPVEQDAEELDEEVGGYVLVVPGRPRYHVEGCRYLAGKDVEEVDILDARDEGFTPCGVCKPDEVLAAAVELDEVVTADSEQALDAADISPVEPAAQDELAVDASTDELAEEGEETAVVAAAEVLVDDAEVAPAATRTAGADPVAAAFASPATDPSLGAELEPAFTPPTRRRGSKAVGADALVPAPDAPVPARKAARAATRAVPAVEPVVAKAPRKRAAAPAAAPAAPTPAPAPAKKAAGRTRSAAVPDVATPTRSARKAPGAVVAAPAAPAVAAPAKKAARAAAVATPAGATASKRGTVVVIPDRGRFHRAECRYVRGVEDAVELTKATATRQGYEACGVCKP